MPKYINIIIKESMCLLLQEVMHYCNSCFQKLLGETTSLVSLQAAAKSRLFNMGFIDHPPTTRTVLVTMLRLG